jgi:hypothetical protein
VKNLRKQALELIISRDKEGLTAIGMPETLDKG